MKQSFDDFLREERNRNNKLFIPESDIPFRFEFLLLMCIWGVMTFVAQYCVLAETFGNNWFFAMTDIVTTYVMHIIYAKSAFDILRAKFFPRDNVFYVSLRYTRLADVFALICAFSIMVLIVVYF